MSNIPTKKEPTGRNEIPPQATLKILRSLEGLRYGSVEIIIHDGQVTQIERREKSRIN